VSHCSAFERLMVLLALRNTTLSRVPVLTDFSNQQLVSVNGT
jgi:hypothetical protein